jgi:hypothetical protein
MEPPTFPARFRYPTVSRNAPAWLSSRQGDFISTTLPTDRNAAANANGFLFLFYLRYYWNFTWLEIIEAGAPTLAETYQNLTGRGDALNVPVGAYNAGTTAAAASARWIEET